MSLNIAWTDNLARHSFHEGTLATCFRSYEETIEDKEGKLDAEGARFVLSSTGCAKVRSGATRMACTTVAAAAAAMARQRTICCKCGHTIHTHTHPRCSITIVHLVLLLRLLYFLLTITSVNPVSYTSLTTNLGIQ